MDRFFASKSSFIYIPYLMLNAILTFCSCNIKIRVSYFKDIPAFTLFIYVDSIKFEYRSVLIKFIEIDVDSINEYDNLYFRLF